MRNIDKYKRPEEAYAAFGYFCGGFGIGCDGCILKNVVTSVERSCLVAWLYLDDVRDVVKESGKTESE